MGIEIVGQIASLIFNNPQAKQVISTEFFKKIGLFFHSHGHHTLGKIANQAKHVAKDGGGLKEFRARVNNNTSIQTDLSNHRANVQTFNTRVASLANRAPTVTAA